MNAGGRLTEYDPRPRSSLSPSFVGVHGEQGRQPISSEGRYTPEDVVEWNPTDIDPILEYI